MHCLPRLFSRWEQSTARSSEEDTLLHVKLYSYKEIKAATHDFSPTNKIGEGGFGSLYKGNLKHGKVAAIRVLSVKCQQGVREFLDEIKVISEVQHENLVELYGCCVEGDHRILVYNYLEKNSLALTLLGRKKCDIKFSWRKRLKICIGIARGLAYLHEEVRPHIVHRDIKASNILLDKDLSPKISDFGLARLMLPNAILTLDVGNLGYLAPDYITRGDLTRKIDIYSFGVLLLEIVCGRCNTNMSLPNGERFLLVRTWESYRRKELVGLVDESLEGLYDAEEACRFLKIGLLCTQGSPKLRPAMSTVVKMLMGEIDMDEMKIAAPEKVQNSGFGIPRTTMMVPKKPLEMTDV